MVPGVYHKYEIVSHLGINPVIGGRPLKDRRMRDSSRVWDLFENIILMFDDENLLNMENIGIIIVV